jgi:hypothetical protein
MDSRELWICWTTRFFLDFWTWTCTLQRIDQYLRIHVLAKTKKYFDWIRSTNFVLSGTGAHGNFNTLCEEIIAGLQDMTHLKDLTVLLRHTIPETLPISFVLGRKLPAPSARPSATTSSPPSHTTSQPCTGTMYCPTPRPSTPTARSTRGPRSQNGIWVCSCRERLALLERLQSQE